MGRSGESYTKLQDAGAKQEGCGTRAGGRDVKLAKVLRRGPQPTEADGSRELEADHRLRERKARARRIRAGFVESQPGRSRENSRNQRHADREKSEKQVSSTTSRERYLVARARRGGAAETNKRAWAGSDRRAAHNTVALQAMLEMSGSTPDRARATRRLIARSKQKSKPEGFESDGRRRRTRHWRRAISSRVRLSAKQAGRLRQELKAALPLGVLRPRLGCVLWAGACNLIFGKMTNDDEDACGRGILSNRPRLRVPMQTRVQQLSRR